MNAGIAAFRAGNAPHIMQVFEVGTATMMARQRRRQAGPRADEGGGREVRSEGLPAGHHRLLLDRQGRDAVVPVQLVLDGDVDQQGRAEEGRPRPEIPKTWPEVFEAAKKLKAAGHATCGFSNAWATWANIEQFSAWHNVPIATKANGLDGFDTELKFNSPLHVKHLQNLVDPAEGQDLRLFGAATNTRRGPLHLRRMPDLPDLLGLLRQRQGQREVRLRHRADAVLSGRRRARRRTRSSAAPRCG